MVEVPSHSDCTQTAAVTIQWPISGGESGHEGTVSLSADPLPQLQPSLNVHAPPPDTPQEKLCVTRSGRWVHWPKRLFHTYVYTVLRHWGGGTFDLRVYNVHCVCSFVLTRYKRHTSVIFVGHVSMYVCTQKIQEGCNTHTPTSTHKHTPD